MKISGNIFFFLLFVLITFNSAYSQKNTPAPNYWIRQVSPTNKWLTKSTFIDSLYGWAVGDSGIVIHTSNGGANWNVQSNPAGSNLIDDIFFLNRTNGWMIYNDYFNGSSFLLKTNNSGDAWTASRFFDTTTYLTTVFFNDSLTGYLGTIYGQIYKTLNGGLNWAKCTIDSGSCYTFTLRKIKFLNAQTGFGVGGHNDIVGEIWKTTNAGNNWLPQCLSAEPEYDLLYHNGKITAVGGDFEYGVISLQTTNNGVDWIYSNDSCYGVGQTIAMRTPAEFWVPAGFSGKWAVSNDSGKANSWFSLPVPDTSSIYAAYFTSSVNGWAFGTGGSIYKYNRGIIGITNNQNVVPLSASLFQNYPNPFNPSTSIKFRLSKASLIKLRVFDILGKEVKVLINGFIDRGEHSVNFDASSFPSGVYFYQIEARQAGSLTVDFKVSKKMVLIK